MNTDLLRPFAALSLGVTVALSPAPARGQAPTTPPPRQTSTLSGKVQDPEQRPVEGATVRSYSHGTESYPGVDNQQLSHETTTDAKGAFQAPIPADNLLVVVRHSTLASGWKQLWQTRSDTNLTLTLTPPATVAGTVVDAQGQPVPQVEVFASMVMIQEAQEPRRHSYAFLAGKPAQDCYSTRTDAQGRFRLERFPTNSALDLAVAAPGMALRQPPREYVAFETLRCRAGQQDVRLSLEAAGHLEGRILTDEPGLPPPPASLAIQDSTTGFTPNRPSTASGPDGAFTLRDLAAGDYTLIARFGTNRLPEWVADTVAVKVQSGQTTRDVKVTATRGGLLEVVVRAKDTPTPVGGVSLNLHRPEYQTGDSTGPDGSARLRLPAGDYQLFASKDHAQAKVESISVLAAQTNRCEVILNPPPRITGTLRDPENKPIPKTQVFIFPNYFDPQTSRVTTDDQGRFEIQWDPRRFGGSDRNFALIARSPGRNLAVAHDIDEQTTTLDLALEPALTLTGRVETTEARPIPNASVSTILWAGNMGSGFDEPVTTDSQGRFTVSALPAGRRYSVTATADGFGSASLQVEPDPADNQPLELDPFVLQVADRKLAGVIVDADEKPVSRAHVYIYGPGQPNTSAQTDDQGRFRFDAVCEGQVRISANTPGAYGSMTAEAGDTNVVVQLGQHGGFGPTASARPSLLNQPLPDLTPTGLSPDTHPVGQPRLLCLFDLEQRPSRRAVRFLADQHPTLSQRGATLLAIQATPCADTTFTEWKTASPLPFPIGRVTEKSPDLKWLTEVTALPWLILTDAENKVVAEGFSLEDLPAQMEKLKPRK